MSELKKVALVTGANKGIGFETARQLGTLGIIVLIGARNQTRGEAAAEKLRSEDLEAHFIQIDVTDQASIDIAAEKVDRMYGKLDILINNAGISLREWNMPPSQLDIAVLRTTYETNVFGAFAVTKAMLPLLRRADAGRIVNVSSSMGSLSLNSDPDSFAADIPPILAYNSSKTALNALTVFFAKELRGTSIKINSANPGYCATDLNNHSGPQTAAQGAKISVQLATLPDDGPGGGFFAEEGEVLW